MKLRPWKKVSHFAPWISHTIPEFEKIDDVELHIIAPHEYICGKFDYRYNGVHYHFFNPFIPFWGRHWPSFFKWDVWTNYAKSKRIVANLINRIKPDIIHLQGAENPYYSSTILPLLDHYPIVVNLQRISLEFLSTAGIKPNTRAAIEKEILTRAKNFAIRTETMAKDFRSFNSDARIYWVNYVMPELKPLKLKIEYDIVFFARVCKDKGIEDLMHAMGIVNSALPRTRLCVIGSVKTDYKEHLETMAKQAGVTNQILWKGRLPELKDVHLEASKAKVSVLPTYNDIISGTVIESMQLGLPVVSYKTGSIPELNVDQENVLLVDKGDIHGLANNIIRLLTDTELYQTMSQRGINCMKERYSNQNVLQQHLDCYLQVIDDFHKSNSEDSKHKTNFTNEDY